MHDIIKAELDKVLDTHSIADSSTRLTLRSVFLQMVEEDDNIPTKTAEWIIGWEDYFDTLESCQCGHRRVLKWLRKNSYDDVTLTKIGCKLFLDMEVAYYRCFGTTPQKQLAIETFY